MTPLLKISLSLILLNFSITLSAQAKEKKRTKLPSVLEEVSGLVYAAKDSLWWQNDGGHGPVLYLTNSLGQVIRTDTLRSAKNIDWEDLTTDRKGNIYIGDFGNNLGRRQSFLIYRYQPETKALDSIVFRYPGQDGQGREVIGNYDTEAFFFDRDSLHLFTKDLLPRSDFLCKHFVIPAQAGSYTAQLRDSMPLRRRVVTAAAISGEGEVAITAYYFGFWLGFIPHSAATVYTLSDYPPGRYLQGKWKKRKLSCLIPTQYESVDFFQEYIYVAREKTPFNKQKMKRKKKLF